MMGYNMPAFLDDLGSPPLIGAPYQDTQNEPAPPPPPPPPVVRSPYQLDPATTRSAGQEDPFGSQPVRQQEYLRWNATPMSVRREVFSNAANQALDAEGITDPTERAHWIEAMFHVAEGDQQTHGENPWLNPFAQAYDFDDRPAQGVNPRLAGTPQGDATASSARGYYQFLTRPNGATPSTWDLVRLPSRDGEEELPQDSVFDPVANQRGFIRAVRRASNYTDPDDVWREKQRHQVWNPQLPLPKGNSQ